MCIQEKLRIAKIFAKNACTFYFLFFKAFERDLKC